ncbi:hypothetical protein [Streptomyces sp. NPDC058092]|uniref:hypothetical protein n=1 Tax=Streptomyces sp. NPDC058092 TaxID=3346336 RepID=UPI0036ECF23A
MGQLMEGNARALEAAWESFAQLAPDAHATEYMVRLAPGADARAYAEAVAALNSGLHASVMDSGNAGTATVITFLDGVHGAADARRVARCLQHRSPEHP